MVKKSQKPVNVAYEQPLIPKIHLQKVRLLWAKLKQVHTLFSRSELHRCFYSLVQLEISKLHSATATTYTKYVMNYVLILE